MSAIGDVSKASIGHAVKHLLRDLRVLGVPLTDDEIRGRRDAI